MPESAYERFGHKYDALLECFKSSGDPDAAYARMVGTLRVIVPFAADDSSLERIMLSMDRSIQQQTLNILARPE